MWRISATGVHPSPENADFGGPMRLLRSYVPWHVRKSDITIDNGDPGFIVSYQGGFVPTFFGTHPDPPPWGDFNQLDPDPAYGSATQFGAEGWNRFQPTLKAVDQTAILYELKDLPDQLKTSAELFRGAYKAFGGKASGEFMSPKPVADNFLNQQFGWGPFLDDMTNTFLAYRNARKNFRKLKQENGRWIHRRGTVRKILESSEELFTDHYAYVAPDLGSLSRWDTAPDGNLTRGYSRFIHETEERVWFSAEFRYWVPDLVHDEHSLYSYVMNRAAYYGVRVNPYLIWKLTPWTWLADWFGNVSQFYRSVADDAADNLVARYAYVMCHLEKRTRHFATVFLSDGRDAEMAWTAFYESKHRAKASPFGFDLTPGDLSDRQVAILAALGISRVF